jgi:hypothetical protein
LEIKEARKRERNIIMRSDNEMSIRHELCGYSNCFRPYFKHRGFMPTCEFHYKNPAKWGKDGLTYTGSVWRKKEECVICQETKPTDFDGYCQECHDEIANRNVREGTK